MAPRLPRPQAILKEQISVLQGKVDRILQHAETEHRFFKLSKEIIDLSALLEETTGEFRHVASHKNGRLDIVNHTGNPVILADKYHLNGILINLLDNALKYNDKEPVVTVFLEEKAGKIHLTVTDNGIGMDKKYISKIFMPFFRVPSGNIHNVKGSGLGLSYVKKVCDLHRWKIRISSEPGTGTKILIIIPKAG